MMAYSDALARQIRDCLADRSGVVEKNMFGGLMFMLDGNMVCGVTQDDILLRVGAANYKSALAQSSARPMELGGRLMKGFVVVTGAALTDDEIATWVRAAIRYAASLPPK